MKIVTQCPFCSCHTQLSEHALDRRIRCEKCGLLFKIPHPDQLDSAINKLKNTNSTIYIDSKGNTYA